MNTFLFEVDYDHSREEMIAAGGYAHVDPRVRRIPFASAQKGMVRFEGRRFSWGPETETFGTKNILDRIRGEDPANPWDPSGIEHLLAYMATHPSVDRATTFALFALENGRAPFTYVHWRNRRVSGPSLAIEDSDDEWWSQWSDFLAVRKVA
jgi:hypothetical protein